MYILYILEALTHTYKHTYKHIYIYTRVGDCRDNLGINYLARSVIVKAGGPQKMRSRWGLGPSAGSAGRAWDWGGGGTYIYIYICICAQHITHSTHSTHSTHCTHS